MLQSPQPQLHPDSTCKKKYDVAQPVALPSICTLAGPTDPYSNSPGETVVDMNVPPVSEPRPGESQVMVSSCVQEAMIKNLPVTPVGNVYPLPVRLPAIDPAIRDMPEFGLAFE
jgi:hypothetical protein